MQTTIRKIGVKIEGGIEELVVSLPAINGLHAKFADAKITIALDANALACSDILVPQYSAISLEDFQAEQYDLIPNQLSSPWKLYEEQVANKNVINPFHRSDMKKLVWDTFHFDEPVQVQLPVEEIEHMRRRLNPEERSKILFDVSALNTKQSAQLVNAILSSSENTRVYFFGTLKDRGQSTNILSLIHNELRHRCWDFTGSTTIRELFCLSYLADIVITKPGLSAQITALIGTQTICLLPESGWHLNSAPYANGHILIRPRSLNAENESAFLKALTEICLFPFFRNTSESVTDIEWAAFFEQRLEQDIHLYSSYITQVHSIDHTAGAYTQLYFLPLIFLGTEPLHTIHSIYRILWLYSLSDIESKAYDLELLHFDTIDSLRSLLPTIDNLAQLSAFGQKYSQYIENSLRRGLLEKARKDGEQLSEVDRLLAMLSLNTPELAPLVNILRAEQEEINIQDPVQASADMSKCYRNLQERILVFLDLLQSLFNKNTVAEESTAHGESIY